MNNEHRGVCRSTPPCFRPRISKTCEKPSEALRSTRSLEALRSPQKPSEALRNALRAAKGALEARLRRASSLAVAGTLVLDQRKPALNQNEGVSKDVFALAKSQANQQPSAGYALEALCRASRYPSPHPRSTAPRARTQAIAVGVAVEISTSTLLQRGNTLPFRCAKGSKS